MLKIKFISLKVKTSELIFTDVLVHWVCVQHYRSDSAQMKLKNKITEMFPVPGMAAILKF